MSPRAERAQGRAVGRTAGGEEKEEREQGAGLHFRCGGSVGRVGWGNLNEGRESVGMRVVGGDRRARGDEAKSGEETRTSVPFPPSYALLSYTLRRHYALRELQT